MIDFIKRGFFLLLIILPLMACSESYTYEGKAIKGRVVDAASLQPLEGAVVAALWAKRGGLHTDTIGYVHLDEAVTDSQGYYELKAWGPVEVSDGYMGSFSPDLIVFKQGYKYQRVNEGFLPPAKDRRVWTSKWDGEVIELERFEGNIYEYKYHLDFLDVLINEIRNGKHCEWKGIPYFLVEIHKTETDLRQKELDYDKKNSKIKKVGSSLKNIRSVYEVSNQEKCGIAQDFFEEYLNEG